MSNRRERVIHVYAGIGLGTVLAALLCVGINRILLGVRRNGFFNAPGYRPLVMEEQETLGAPLSLKTRLDLFAQCEIEGPERLPLPEELSKNDILLLTRELWEQYLEEMVTGSDGEALNRIVSESRASAVLRDFYNETTGARLSLWCTQVWYETESVTRCLSLELDSRTGEPLYLCAAFYGDGDGAAAMGMVPYARALGYELTDEMLAGISVTSTDTGYVATLPLGDGVCIEKNSQTGTQYTLRVLIRSSPNGAEQDEYRSAEAEK